MSRRFQRDLQGAVEFIQAPGPLKEAVKKLYRSHCKETLDTASIDEQVLSEYDRQREFLEKNVDTLKHKLHAEVLKHKAANSKAMLVSCFQDWTARCNAWLLITLMPRAVVCTFLSCFKQSQEAVGLSF